MMRMRAVLMVVAVLVLGAWTCAPTDSPGSAGVADVPISTTGLTALVAGEDWHYVGEAGEPAFENSWVNSGVGFAMLAFRIRESGIVDIQGTVTGGASSSAIFTLPEGYRPSNKSIIPVSVSSPGAYEGAYVTITTSGSVTPKFSLTSSVVFIYAQMFLSPPDELA